VKLWPRKKSHDWSRWRSSKRPPCLLPVLRLCLLLCLCLSHVYPCKHPWRIKRDNSREIFRCLVLGSSSVASACNGTSAGSLTFRGTSLRVRSAVTSEVETLSSSLVWFVLGACLPFPPVPPALRAFVVSLSLTADSYHITGTPSTDLLAIRVARVPPCLSFGVVVISWFVHLCSHPWGQNPKRLPLRPRDAWLTGAWCLFVWCSEETVHTHAGGSSRGWRKLRNVELRDVQACSSPVKTAECKVAPWSLIHAWKRAWGMVVVDFVILSWQLPESTE